MTDEHPHITVLRDFFEAFGRADRDRLSGLVADDLIWHFPGTSPIAGDWHGIAGLLDGIRATAMALGDGHLGFELLHVYADDTSTVTVHRDYFTGTGNDLDLRFVLYARMASGRIAEVWEMPFDQSESERFFAVQAGALARRLTTPPSDE